MSQPPSLQMKSQGADPYRRESLYEYLLRTSSLLFFRAFQAFIVYNRSNSALRLERDLYDV